MNNTDLPPLVPLVIGALIEWLFYSLWLFVAGCIVTTLNGEMSWQAIGALLGTAPVIGFFFLIYARVEDYRQSWRQRKAALRKQDEQNQRNFVREIKRLTQ